VVLDDGTQTEDLPPTLAACAGGGMGNSQAEKSVDNFLQPYLQSRQVGFCPSDKTPRSRFLATDLQGYNGNVADSSGTPRQ